MARQSASAGCGVEEGRLKAGEEGICGGHPGRQGRCLEGAEGRGEGGRAADDADGAGDHREAAGNAAVLGRQRRGHEIGVGDLEQADAEALQQQRQADARRAGWRASRSRRPQPGDAEHDARERQPAES